MVGELRSVGKFTANNLIYFYSSRGQEAETQTKTVGLRTPKTGLA